MKRNSGSFKCAADKAKAIKKAASSIEKQTTFFKKVIAGKYRPTEGSYKIAQCIAKSGKTFTDGEYIKRAFLSCSDVLFDDLPNKDTIIKNT